MLLLHQLVLVSALAQQVAFALPLPLQIGVDGEDLLVRPSPTSNESSSQADEPLKDYNSIASHQVWNNHSPDTVIFSPPHQHHTVKDTIYITLSDHEGDSASLYKRGMFGFFAKSGIGLAKAGAKSGAFNMITNGATKLMHLRRRSAGEVNEVEQMMFRRAPVFGNDNTAIVEQGGQHLQRRFKIGNPFKKTAKMTTGAVPGVKKSSFGGKLSNAANVMMLVSSLGAMIPMGKSKAPAATTPATTTPPAHQPAAQPPSKPVTPPPTTEMPAHPTKRSIDESEAYPLSSLTKRGQVANVAGGAVTTLMFINIGKQVMGAVSSHLPGNKNNAAQPYVVRAYIPDAQGMVLYKRQHGEEANHPHGQQPPPPQQQQRRRPGVMEGMSTVVTIGFGGQAIQENAGPISRETKRIAKKLSDVAHHVLNPKPVARGLTMQYAGDTNMVKRMLQTEKDEVRMHTRGMVPQGIKKFTPQVMNGVGHIVTVSMLTGMAGPFIDSAIKTIKGPRHPDNMRPARRDLFPKYDEIPSRLTRLYPCSVTDQSCISEQARLTELQEEEEENDNGTLEKRANFGKIVGNVMKNKIVKQAMSIASLAL